MTARVQNPLTAEGPPRRRFRFTLRTLLLAHAAVALLLGITTGVYRYYAVKWAERRATAEMYPYGGVYTMASALHARRTGKPKCWFFTTFLNYVEAVDLSPYNVSAKKRQGTLLPVDDDAIALLRKFPHLRSLDLRDTDVTDAGLPHVQTLRHLEHLDVRATGITNEGLESIGAALPDCTILHDHPHSSCP